MTYDNHTARDEQPISWTRRVIVIVIVSGVLAVLAALAWPTIEKPLGLADLNLGRFWASITVAATFSLTCFFVYFVADKSLWEFFESPGVMVVIGGIATFALAQVVVVNLARTGRATAVSDNAALIGAVVALGGVFTAQMVGIALENKRTREARRLEAQRTQEARQLETQRANEAALQRYFENVSTLLIEQPLRRASPGDNLSTVVRAQTLSVLEGLDPARKRILLQFLYESGLIYEAKPVVSLAVANLFDADLSGAILIGANLNGANLSGAELSGADLSSAYLSDADLSNARLSNARLSNARLSNARLSNASGVTEKQLEKQARTLEGATMPNGQKYEDWLKDKKAQGKDEKNE